MIKSDKLSAKMDYNFKIGFGYDVHRFSKDRKLILGGVEILLKKDLKVILMPMFYCMLCVIQFLVQLDLKTSGINFLILTDHLRIFQV